MVGFLDTKYSAGGFWDPRSHLVEHQIVKVRENQGFNQVEWFTTDFENIIRVQTCSNHRHAEI